jgi:hypothetical protein
MLSLIFSYKILIFFFFFSSAIYHLYFKLKSVQFPGCVISSYDPIFFSLALYSPSKRKKLTEDFYVDSLKEGELPFSLMV